MLRRGWYVSRAPGPVTWKRLLLKPHRGCLFVCLYFRLGKTRGAHNLKPCYYQNHKKKQADAQHFVLERARKKNPALFDFKKSRPYVLFQRRNLSCRNHRIATPDKVHVVQDGVIHVVEVLLVERLLGH